MESSNKLKYDLYRNEKTDKVWWIDNDSIGSFLFTFDMQKVYNLFADYPQKLSVEEWMIFNKENPYWKEFFKDRNEMYELEHMEEIDKIRNEELKEKVKQ